MTRPSLGDRQLFPDLKVPVYLSHAAISPPSIAVVSRAREVLETYAKGGIAAWGPWCEQRERLRAKLATLVGTSPQGVALVANTTTAVQAVAQHFPWQAGDRVVLFDGEFPTNVTPWQCAARQHGLKLEWFSADRFRTSRAEALDGLQRRLRSDPPRLVAISWVEFQTGLRMPVEEIRRGLSRVGDPVIRRCDSGDRRSSVGSLARGC